MLELATLGLLQGEPLNGYRLKQQMELFMSGCISVNYGAIYPLLKRLEQNCLIAVLDDQEDRSLGRKIYTITDLGKIRWKEKMLDHPQESWVHSRSRFMIKFFFFSYLEPEERLKLLEHRLMMCRLRLEGKELENIPTDPYQLAACQRYRLAIEDEIQWLESQIISCQGLCENRDQN
jgi:DNA-binding PadR family transcriptional regulator